MKKQSHAYRAYTNIALIKYWGKRNNELFLPMTSSLSLTLAGFYTETQISYCDQGTGDQFILNGQVESGPALTSVSAFIDLFRDYSRRDIRVKIDSYNHVPTAAGLASSASAFAALACAANDFFDSQLDSRQLSTFARRGSGSASRSLFGGFTLWHQGQGDDSDSSYAEMIDSADWDIGMVVVMINTQKKNISSRDGMKHTLKTSPFYSLWPETVAHDLSLITKAIEDKDFTSLGEITEHNAMKMHATMIAAKPSLTYWQPDSLVAMEAVRQLRARGISCYFTMDAGPNVKILCRLSQSHDIKDYLEQYFAPEKVIITGPGPSPHLVEKVGHHD